MNKKKVDKSINYNYTSIIIIILIILISTYISLMKIYLPPHNEILNGDKQDMHEEERKLN